MNIELSVEKLFLADSPLHDFIHVQDEYLFKDGETQIFIKLLNTLKVVNSK